ncbi:MAG: hypothetical protein JSW07_07080, partial [bacterium]
SGLLFDPANCNELAMKINRLLDNPEEAKIMGLLGRKKVRRYSAHTARNIWIDMLSNIANGNA